MGHSGSDRPVILLSIAFLSLKHPGTSFTRIGACDPWLRFRLHIHAGFDLYGSRANHPALRGLIHSPDYRLTVDIPDAPAIGATYYVPSSKQAPLGAPSVLAEMPDYATRCCNGLFGVWACHS